MVFQTASANKQKQRSKEPMISDTKIGYHPTDVIYFACLSGRSYLPPGERSIQLKFMARHITPANEPSYLCQRLSFPTRQASSKPRSFSPMTQFSYRHRSPSPFMSHQPTNQLARAHDCAFRRRCTHVLHALARVP